MLRRESSGTTSVIACLLAMWPWCAQAQTTPQAAPQSVQGSAAASPPADPPGPPATARTFAYVRMNPLLSETAVGRDSSARVKKAQGTRRYPEVQAEEQQRIQSLFHPLVQTIRARRGIGMILAADRSVVYCDTALDLTADLKSMVEEGQPAPLDRAVEPLARLGVVNVVHIAADSRLGKALREHPPANATAAFIAQLSPVIADFTHDAGVRLLLSSTDAGIVWSDPGVDATSTLVAWLDKATEKNAPAPPPWSPPPAALAYVRLAALADGAGLAQEASATVKRLADRAGSARASDGDRQRLANAKEDLKKQIIAAVVTAAERECRARNITVLLSMADSGILDADGALDLTDTLLRAVSRR